MTTGTLSIGSQPKRAASIRVLRCSCLFALIGCFAGESQIVEAAEVRPNILIAISDDQSFAHVSKCGDSQFATPAFDRVARAGVRFTSAITPSPGCSPMRAAFLSGRPTWACGAAGTHASDFPLDLPTFPDRLARGGYHVGMTGKGWGPGKHVGWPHNPAGPGYQAASSKVPAGIHKRDYAANFEAFLNDRQDQQPFCFWYGGFEPHRAYDPGIGRRNGIDPDEIELPPFLADAPEVREDVADYLYEIQHFDAHLGRMLDQLAERGLLENTLVIVTSDNGMPFPAAKANLYEYGIHMPLAIAWPRKWKGDRTCARVVSLLDVTATIADVAGVELTGATGTTLTTLLENSKKPTSWTDRAFSARERHSSSRYNTRGYPGRAIRTPRHLLVINERPERMPAGPAQKFDSVLFGDDLAPKRFQLGPVGSAYHDIDDGPTLRYLVEHADDPNVAESLALATAVRPRVELFDIVEDPGCQTNLAEDPEHASTRKALLRELREHRLATGDLRAVDAVAGEKYWEAFPRHSPLRWFPVPEGESAVAGPAWLERRRPR